MKKATTDAERKPINEAITKIKEKQGETQKESEELKEKQRIETHTMHYDYDQHLKNNREQTPTILKEREDLKYIHDRSQHLERLDRNFNKTKQDYFINPSTGDWRSFDEFKALPADKQKQIKDGYRNDLYDRIKPSLESLKGAFGSGASIKLGRDPLKNQAPEYDIFAGARLSGLQTRDSQIKGPRESYTMMDLDLQFNS